MSLGLKPIGQQVVVVTGASSGIGRATALEAARRGARVVVASRNRDDLIKVCNEISEQGGQAQYCVCDVSQIEDVEKLAEVAHQSFGYIDSWVNNAGVGLYGYLLDFDNADERRLFDINFWGLVNGSKTAAKLMTKGGAIINVGSIASDMTFPLQGMYCSSKHAVKAFTDGLRIELSEADRPISVTLIKPAAINTPFPQHARNYMSREPKLPDPAYPASEVANAIIYACENSKRDIYVGGFGRFLTLIQKFVPTAMDWAAARGQSAAQLRQEPARCPTGNLQRSSPENKTDGAHPGYTANHSAYSRASMSPFLIWSVAGISVAAILASRQQRRQYRI
jgi:short-subunit dehydrogenase